MQWTLPISLVVDAQGPHLCVSCRCLSRSRSHCAGSWSTCCCLCTAPAWARRRRARRWVSCALCSTCSMATSVRGPGVAISIARHPGSAAHPPSPMGHPEPPSLAPSVPGSCLTPGSLPADVQQLLPGPTSDEPERLGIESGAGGPGLHLPGYPWSTADLMGTGAWQRDAQKQFLNPETWTRLMTSHILPARSLSLS